MRAYVYAHVEAGCKYPAILSLNTSKYASCEPRQFVIKPQYSKKNQETFNYTKCPHSIYTKCPNKIHHGYFPGSGSNSSHTAHPVETSVA